MEGGRPSAPRPPKILVLGVGNILLKDEGAGVRVAEKLAETYEFSDNVEVMDGGTLGLRLIDPISQAARLIVVDAALCGGSPGDIFRLGGEGLRRCRMDRNSMHDLSLEDVLGMAALLGARPEAVVLGIEPADITPFGLELTEPVARRLPDLLGEVLKEIAAAGGSFRRRKAPRRGKGGDWHVSGRPG